MTKRFIFICILLLVGTVSTGSFSDNSMRTGRPLVVVHSNNTPPLSYVGLNREPEGLVVDYWKAWSFASGNAITFVQAEWPETLEMVRDGRADIHGGLYYSEERDRYLDFSEPFFSMDAAIYVRKSLGIHSLMELGYTPVAVLELGYSESYLRKSHPWIRQKAYKSSEQMVEAAFAGEVDVLLTEHTTMVNHLGTRNKLEEFIPIKTLYSRSICGAVAQGNAGILQLVKDGEAKITAKKRERLFSHWVVLSSSTSNWLVAILVVGATVLIGAILFALFHNRR
jgi:ABC-type amino acid transport substrate-binding protein